VDFEVVGRLAAGATIATANAEVDAFARRLADAYPVRYADTTGRYRRMPVVSLHDATVGEVLRPVLLLLGGAALLLVIACANVAHLVLARSLGRDREFAVRRAIGAGRGAVMRQVLGESLLLGGAGALIGAGLAWMAVRALHVRAPDGIPRLSEVTVDPRAFVVALGVSVLTAAAAGLLPAIVAARRSDAGPLRAGSRSATVGRGTNRLRAGLVVAEIALSLVLVIQAGLLVRSLNALNRVDAGFNMEGLWTARLPRTSVAGRPDDPARVERIRNALAAVPGIRAVTYGLTLPVEWSSGPRCCWAGFSSLAGGLQRTLTWVHPVRHDYFEVLGARLLSGSAWEPDAETGTPRPVVINEALARALFGSSEGAVGRSFDFGEDPMVVVGLAAEVRQFGLDRAQPPAIYRPAAIMDRASLAVRAEPGVDVARAVRAAVWSVEPALPVPVVEPMTEVARRSTTGPRFDSLLVGTFGAVALLLATGGLSGTLFYLVSERRREIGIRLALGAPARRIERNVAAQGATWAVLGIAIGVAGGLAVARLIQDRLFQVEGTDPVTLVATTGLLGAVAILASWLPARKAARTNPLETLRAE
jgi:putative ABC transport system permease protein